MTKKNLTILISVISAVLVAGLIAVICVVCLNSCDSDAPKTPSYSVIDIDTGYEWYYQPQNRDEHDADTKIDGVLDDARWQGNKKWLTHKEKNVSMRYTTSFSEKGLYIAAEAVDAHMVHNDVRAFLQNSSFCFYVVSNQATQYNVFDCFEFYVDEKNSACRQQTHFTAKAVKSADAAGVPKLTAEFFASWDALHYKVDETTKMPDAVRVSPMYRYVESMGSADNAYLKPVFTEWGNGLLNSTLRFNADGYINIDVEGAEVGNAANGFAKSDGWDLSNVKGENGSKSVKTNQPSSQAIFFSNISSSRYSYSVNMEIKGGIDDENPSAGILDMKSAREFNIMRIRYKDYIDNGKKRLNCFFLDFYVTIWHDALEGAFDFDESMDIINLRVIKDDTRYYYILNGKYCIGKDIDWLGGKTTPGFASLGADVEYSDWQVTDYEGEDKDEEFKALCAQYLNVITVPERVSGGTLTVDKVAVEKGKTESVRLVIQPSVGYILTDLTINGESVYDRLVPQMVNGVLYIDVDKDTAIDATFTALPAASTLRITGQVKRTNGNAVIGLPYTVQSAEEEYKNVLFSSSNTTASGMFDIRVLKAGTYTIGNKTITTDGKYKLLFHGVFPQGEQNVFDIDTTAPELSSVTYYQWQDIIVNPFRVSNMIAKDDHIQTTVTDYAGVISSYYVENTTVTGSFRLDLTVNAANDVWPCYGITIEDESNNSVQFFAGGSDIYRLTRNYSYDFVTQAVKGVAYKDKISKQYLIYNAEEDTFYFYVNDALFDTVKRNRYLVGTTFKFGVCGYMVGADGSFRPVTDDDPLAKFTRPQVKQSFRATIPSGASLTVNGTAVTDNMIPVCTTATVSIPVPGDGIYNFYIDGNVLETVISDGVATATFQTFDDCEITFERTYEINGKAETKVSGVTVEGATVNAANAQGRVVYSAKADAEGKYTLRLPNGTFYVTAQTQTLVSSATAITVTDGTVSGETNIAIDKYKLIASEYSEIPYDLASGKYAMKEGLPLNAGYFSGVVFTRNQSYVLYATVEKFSGNNFPSSGFIVRVGSKNYRFVVRNIDGIYDTVAWHNSPKGDTFGKMQGTLGDDPFTQVGETMDIALVFHNGTYHMFVNNTEVFSVTEIDAANNIRPGLFCERDVTFADWGYSVDVDEVRRYLGVTLNLEEGITATVGGAALVDNKAIVGDEITLTKAVSADNRISFVLDGTAQLETTITDGVATAKFKATRNVHSVTTLSTYAVSGVTGANATVVFAYASGDEATTATADADGNFTAYLGGDTDYYVHAYNSARISAPRKVAVAKAAVTGVELTLNRYKLTQKVDGYEQLYYDAVSGGYRSEDEYINAMTFADISPDANATFALTASVKSFNAPAYASAGLIVEASNGNKYRFVLRYNGNGYDMVEWMNAAGIVHGIDGTLGNNPFTGNGNTAEIALVYGYGTFRFYVNNTFVYAASAINRGALKVGLFCEHAIEYVDWNYTDDISAYGFYALNGSVASGTTAVNITNTDGSSPIKAMLNGTRYAAIVPNGSYLVSAENDTKITSAQAVTVNNAAATADFAAPDKIKLIDTGIADHYRTLYMTADGNYKSSGNAQYEYNALNAGYFAGVSAGESFVLTATVNKFDGENYPSAGFVVETANGVNRLGLRRRPNFGAGRYDGCTWNDDGTKNHDFVDAYEFAFTAPDSPFDGNKADLALVYADGKYYFFIKGKLAYVVSNFAAPKAGGKVGLFCEREITYTAWGYSANIGGYIQPVSGTANANASVAVVSADGLQISSTTADANGAFTATATVGTNYIVAETADKIGSTEVAVVAGTPCTGATVNADKIKLENAGARQLVFDFKTQNYVTTGNVEDDSIVNQNGFFAGGTITGGKPFVMTATVNKFQNVYDSQNRWLWHSAGFLVAIGETRYTFTFRASGNAVDPAFDTVIWGMSDQPIVSSQIANPFTDSDTMDIAVAYLDGKYYLFCGTTLVNVVEKSHANSDVRLGLSTERKISYAAWNYSENRADLEKYVGRTVDTSGITDKTVTVKVGESVIGAGQKALVGETVTVVVDGVTTGAILLNGTKLDTQISGGALTATFVVTAEQETYAITYSATVKVSGSVTGGDAATTYAIINAAGKEMAVGNCAANGTFEAELPAGEYYLSAIGTDKVSAVLKFTVENSDITNLAVALTNYKLVAVDGKPELNFDGKTGYYTTPTDAEQRYGLFANQTVAANTAFVATTTVNAYAGIWDCTGFAVKANNTLYAFAMRHCLDNAHRYDGVIFGAVNTPQPAFGDELNNALHAVKDTFELALVYQDGTFYMLVNGTYAYSYKLSTTTGVQIGLFSEREHVFKQWGYSTNAADIDKYFHTVSGSVTDGDAATDYFIADAIGAQVISSKCNTDGSFTAKLPNGTFTVNAETATKASLAKQFTVDDADVTVGLQADRIKVVSAAGYHGLFMTTEGYKSSGDFASNDNNAGYFAGINATTNTAYALTATVKRFNSTAWTSAGFIVGIGGGKTYRFVLRFTDASAYDSVCWHETTDVIGVAGDPFAANGTANISLMYYGNGQYAFYVNDTLVHTVFEGDGKNAAVSVGLFCEREITYNAWNYSTDVTVPDYVLTEGNFTENGGAISSVHGINSNFMFFEYVDKTDLPSSYVVKANLSGMSDRDWPSAGIVVSTGNKKYIKFSIWGRNDGVRDYGLLVQGFSGDNKVHERAFVFENYENAELKNNVFTNEGGKAELTLVYTGNTYYVFVNGIQVYKLSENDACSINAGMSVKDMLSGNAVRFGLFAERQITFSDWSYGTDISGYTVA